MQKKAKKFMALAMGAVLAGSVMVSPVKAASTVSGTLNGFTCSGSISKGTKSATATTSWRGSGGTIRVTAHAYYTTSSGRRSSSAANSTISANGIYATAQIGSDPTINDQTTVLGGKGEHQVTYISGSWGPVYTTIGTVF